MLQRNAPVSPTAGSTRGQEPQSLPQQTGYAGGGPPPQLTLPVAHIQDASRDSWQAENRESDSARSNPLACWPSIGSIYPDPTLSQSSRLSLRSSVRGSVSSSSTPHSPGHGRDIPLRRRFNSRHVPESAEELVSSPMLSSDMVSRFSGLMRHLKHNSEWEDQTKQVMASNIEALVPEEFEDMLQNEFERRVSFGDRMNTELMNSAKYVKLLKECGAVIPFDADKRGNRPLGAISLAEADVIFQKVIHDCDYGGRRLTYDLFCKALYLVARAARPDLSSEAAFQELLARIASVAPEDPDRGVAPDLMLDPNVLLKLEDFKPALYDLFKTFCSRNLTQLQTHSRPGSGTIRLTERSFWRHTQETTGLTGMGRSSMYGPSATQRFNGTYASSRAESPEKQAALSPSSSLNHEQDTSCSNNMLEIDGTVQVTHASSLTLQAATGSLAHSPVLPTTAGGTGEAVEKPDRETRGDSSSRTSSQNAEADAGGGLAGTSRRPQLSLQEDSDFSGRSPAGGDRRALTQTSSPRARSSTKVESVEPIFEDRIPGSSSVATLPHALDPFMPGRSSLSLLPVGTLSSYSDRGTLIPGSTMMSSVSNSLYTDSCTGISQDPYVYANGAPVIKNRRRYMSVSQLLSLCKELKIVPDLLSRLEVVRIFKRAQCAGSHSSSSLYGYLSAEAFIDAAGQLALESYTKPPYNEEYPEPHEKIHAFFMNILRDASSHREVQERFFYGCSGRDR